MKIKILHILFWFVFILEIFSIYFEFENLHFYLNIICAPIIISLYLLLVKNNINIKFLLILLLFYSTDILHLIVEQNINNKFCIYLNSIAYFILISNLIKDIGIKSYKKLDHILLLSVLIIVLFLSYIFYITNEIMLDKNIDYYGLFLSYSILVFILGLLITIKFVLKPNSSNTNLIIVFACFIFTDVFYLVYIVYREIGIFRYFLFLPQFLSYYFLLNYELNRLKIFKIKQ